MSWLELRSVIGTSYREHLARRLTLQDLQNLIEQDSDFVWGYDPRGAVQIVNSDGTTTAIPPHQGFSFACRPHQFFICYELDGSIIIHLNDNEAALRKVQGLAAALGAQIIT